MDDARTTTPGPGSDTGLARRVVASIDLTDLADDRSSAGIDRLCERAARHGTAAVCVWPEHVPRCAELLADTPVRIATVVNFPTGDEPVDDVVEATRRALADGADEIDVVLPYRAFRAGDPAPAVRVLDAVARVVSSVPEPRRTLKVILETGELVDPALVAAATRLAIEHGADFVKTSTGKVATGATTDAARTMLETIRSTPPADGRTVGLKPSGGIRTVEEAGAYLDLADGIMGPDWAGPATFRLGASSLLDDVLRVLGESPDGDAPETSSP